MKLEDKAFLICVPLPFIQILFYVGLAHDLGGAGMEDVEVKTQNVECDQSALNRVVHRQYVTTVRPR